MKRNLIAAATAAFTAFGTPASAAEHIIMILEEGFFPTITYLDPGDTIRFTNGSVGYTARIRSSNGGSYITPSISNNSSYTISVSSFLSANGNSKTFSPADFYRSGDWRPYYNSANDFKGSISYDDAPNG